MPKLVIDNRDIEVPAGTKVIEAAERLGIMIPRFCYHPALGSVGACRVCAVKFLEGPVKGVQMSCMIDAQDGMVVSTMGTGELTASIEIRDAQTRELLLMLAAEKAVGSEYKEFSRANNASNIEAMFKRFAKRLGDALDAAHAK